VSEVAAGGAVVDRGARPRVTEPAPAHHGGRVGFALLSLGALGVVYGDIGTSPLYALQVAFSHENRVAVTHANVLGILSLVFWSLIVVVTIKYVGFLMRADNHGEGGILALTALVVHKLTRRTEKRVVLTLGLLGVALFYGDGVITPAISVLSAVEGTSVASPAFSRWEVPVTLGILAALFLYQRRGTERIGRLFGPIMIVWFITIAALGVIGIMKRPSVLAAVNPLWAADFFVRHAVIGFVSLGAVVLVITGTEALYADMGHFGRRPIATAWLGLVLPALVLCYFGQGALILSDPSVVDNPFFRMVPAALTIPLVVLATVATIIASQAVISGAFSLTQQAIQLGFVPRVTIRHTSSHIRGQIYVPFVNWALFAAIVVLVVGFRTSTALASAYGIAVTGTMVTTTLIAYVVAHRVWGWSRAKTLLVVVPLLVVDLAFFSSNLLKIRSGGWFPLAFGIVAFTVMSTWSRGRQLAAQRVRSRQISLRRFINRLIDDMPVRVPGTAVFLTATPENAPASLIHNIAANHVLHEHVVLFAAKTTGVPHVAPGERVEIERDRIGFVRIVARYGFRDRPDVPGALQEAARRGLDVDAAGATYFLNQVTYIPKRELGGMAMWRKRLFTVLGAGAATIATHLELPPDEVVELGTHVEL
jgi:KUP system potassium uptake protein